MMEFDARSLPNTSMASVTFTFYVNGYTYSIPYVLIYGYAGDGAVTLADATSSGVILGSYDPRTGLGWHTVTLDPAAIMSVAGSTGYIGLRLVGCLNANTTLAGPSSTTPPKLDFTPGTPPAEPTVSVSDVSINEGTSLVPPGVPGTTHAVFTVSLSQASSVPVTVTYQTA